MNPRLYDLISGMGREELRGLEHDIEEGNVRRMVAERLTAIEHRQKICPVCNNDPGEEGYALMFGPLDFRKKATFCGVDCLEYFLGKLKEMRRFDEKGRPEMDEGQNRGTEPTADRRSS